MYTGPAVARYLYPPTLLKDDNIIHYVFADGVATMIEIYYKCTSYT